MQNKASFLFVLLFSSVILGIIDGHPLGIILISFVMFLLASAFGKRIPHTNKKDYYNVLSIVTFVYICSAFFASFAYHDQHHAIFPDCYGYINDLKMTAPDRDFGEFLAMGYLDLEDLNVLHEVGYRAFIIFSNNQLDGASIFTLTYLHTIFGILSMGVMYSILLALYPGKLAKKYTLIFSILSPFYLYSVVILRDIIIAYVYILTIDIVIRNFKWIDALKLICFLLLALGCRLYSGLFICSFIFFYFFKYVYYEKKSRILTTALIFVVIAFSCIYILGSDLLTQSTEELSGYVEFDAERSFGFSSRLMGLPSGVKEVAMSLYSQVNPFPFYDMFRLVDTVPLAFIALLKSIFALWWYFIFYGLCYFLFVNKVFRQLSIVDYCLLGIIVVYIVLNSVQIDVRRIMAVYPLIYVYYLRCKINYSNTINVIQTNKILGSIYSLLLLIYLLFIQR